MTFELGNLQVVVLHDRDTHETYIVDPYDIGAMVPIAGVNGSIGTQVWIYGWNHEPIVVQECLKTILEAMVIAAPGLAD